MLSLPRFTVPIVLAFVAAQACLAQSPQPPKPAPRSPQTEAERVWAQAVPTLKKYSDRRFAVAEEELGRLRRSTQGLATQAGRKEFIDATLSLEAKGRLVADSNRFRPWVRSLYLQHVFPADEMLRQAALTSSNLKQALKRIDDEFLVAMLIDIEKVPEAFFPESLDLRQFNQLVDQELDAVLSKVYDSTGRQIGAFAAGAAGGYAANQIAREAMRDENGQVSLLGELIAFGIGAAADVATESVANEVLQTRQILDQELQGSTDRLIQQCVLSGTPASHLTTEMVNSIRRQNAAMAVLYAHHLGVNIDWAMDYYNYHHKSIKN